LRGTVAGNSISGSPNAGTAAPFPPRQLDLPIDQYALLVRMHSSPSAIVVADSGNLPRSGELPFEIFPIADLTSSAETTIATTDELSRTRLAEIFAPDPTKSVKSIPLTPTSDMTASLLVKTSPASLTETLRSIHGGRADALTGHLLAVRRIALEYQWEVLRQTARCPTPCVVTDAARRIVSANNIFCDMLGRSLDEIAGTPLEGVIHIEKEQTCETPYSPECIEITTPIFIKPMFLFFTSNVSLTKIRTVCGDRLIYVFQDIYTDRRTGNSNILLIQKLSGMMVSEDQPQTVIRRLINLLTLTLSCELVCILRKSQDTEMIVTPYSNRRIDTLHANVIEAINEPVLKPFFAGGNAIFCDNVEKSCPEPSFFRRISPIARFALLPLGTGSSSEYAMLIAWSGSDAVIGPEIMPLLKIFANLVGSLLTSIRLANDSQQEKETLRRYTRLTAGRETRMANLKRENAQLRDLVMKLGAQGKEQLAR